MTIFGGPFMAALYLSSAALFFESSAHFSLAILSFLARTLSHSQNTGPMTGIKIR